VYKKVDGKDVVIKDVNFSGMVTEMTKQGCVTFSEPKKMNLTLKC